MVWAEGNIARSTGRGSIDSPSAINLICPAELVLVAHKGEWNLGRTYVSDLGHDEWLAWTLADWTFPGEHAERVGYPAAFPRSCRALIKLLSFPGDLIIDPFVGSGPPLSSHARFAGGSGLQSQPDRRGTRADAGSGCGDTRARPASAGFEAVQPWTHRAFEDAYRRHPREQLSREDIAYGFIEAPALATREFRLPCERSAARRPPAPVVSLPPVLRRLEPAGPDVGHRGV